MLHANEQRLDDRILAVVRTASREIAVGELEKLLNDQHIDVGRADLRAALVHQVQSSIRSCDEARPVRQKQPFSCTAPLWKYGDRRRGGDHSHAAPRQPR